MLYMSRVWTDRHTT